MPYAPQRRQRRQKRKKPPRRPTKRMRLYNDALTFTFDNDRLRSKCVCLLIVLSVSYSPIKWASISIIGSLFSLPVESLSAGASTIFGLFIALCVLNRSFSLTADFLLLLSVVLCLWSISLLADTGYSSYYIRVLAGFLTSVPYYVLGRTLRDYKTLDSYLGPTAIIITVCMFFWLFVYQIGGGKTYNQTASYLVYPALVISAAKLFDRFSVVQAANLVFAVFLLFAAGSRAPLVLLAMFVVVKAGFAILSYKNWPLIFFYLTLVGGVIVYFADALFLFLLEKLSSYNVSVRLLERLVKGDMLEDDARIRILSAAQHQLFEHPWLGIGLANDRILIARAEVDENIIGHYPHNFFYEIWLHYGLIAGTILLLLFLYVLYRTLVKNKNLVSRNINLIFLFLGFMPLLVSGSYLTSPLFFLFLGITVNTFFRKECALYERYFDRHQLF